MVIYEIKLKIYMLKNILANEIQTKITALLDKGFLTDTKWQQFHKQNCYKGYSMNHAYPLEHDKVYKKDKIYTITIRTVDSNLAKYFSEICVNQFTKEMKGLTAQIKILPKKHLECIYTLTPIVFKDEQKGYWRTHMNLEQFEAQLKMNLYKKWNYFEKTKIEEDFPIYNMIEFLNQGPIGVEYKNIRLLGDKIKLWIADDEMSQNLAYMALGTGLGNMNSRAMGYVNYRWM